MNYETLRTPCFLVDRQKMKANCDDLLDKANQLGVKIRPHVKTHKTIEGALLQFGGTSIGPITVSTLAEADFFEDECSDILYGFPVTPDKFETIAELNVSKDVAVVSDSQETLRKLSEYLEGSETNVPVYLKVDAGASRAGFHYTSVDEIASAAELVEHLPQISFTGLMTHAHHSYASRNPDESRSYQQQENENLKTLIDGLNARGVHPPVISTGSTPTTMLQTEAGVSTEIRPGNYVFYDRFQSDIGTCDREQIACFVMARVAGHYPERNQLLIDAGALAFSKDLGAKHVREKITYGEAYHYPELQVVEISQEHGLVGSDSDIDFEEFPIGSLLRFIPNHSCLTAACFDKYYIEEEGEIIDIWEPAKGW